MRTRSTDRWGVAIRSTSPPGLELFNTAVEDLVSLRGDPLTAAEEAVGEDEDLILGEILRSYLFLYSTSPAGLASASRILEDLDGRADRADGREALHLRAARAWASGEWSDATRSLERALLDEPRDLLALKIAQDLYFFLGETGDLHGVVERVISAWPSDHPGWGYVQGMYAFGLEENLRYGEAERFAQHALEANRGDVWATHALAHVFEMQGRTGEGVSFLTQSSDDWRSSYFAVHNWWHLALYHLERGEMDEVLALYDGPIRRSRSSVWLDVVDAASLLWRLSLIGVDVGERASQLSIDAEQLLGKAVYTFNDLHAVMIFGLVGRFDVVKQVIAASRESVGTNRVVAEKVGLGLLEGFRSFASGHFGEALDLLAAHQPAARGLGGSNAQRDVIDLTIVAAAARSGQIDYARALVAARVDRKPSNAEAAERLLDANFR
jgi:tetratricopeptide (TPR) repeat protein